MATQASLALPGPASRSHVLRVLAVVVVGVGAAVSGVSAAGGNKPVTVLPLAVMTMAVLVMLALRRFDGFVMLLLLVRASVELTRLTGGPVGGGQASVTAKMLDTTTIVSVLFLVAAVLWLVAKRHAMGRLPGSSLRRALMVFSAAAVLSALSSQRHTVSFAEALRILSFVAMFAVLEQLMARRDAMPRFLTAMMLSAVLPLLYTLVTVLAGNPAVEVKMGLHRLTGPFAQSNVFGHYLMVMIITGAALYPYVSRRVKLALVPGLGLAVWLLALTYTRTALIGTVVGLAVVGVVQSKRLLIGVVVGCACVALFVPALTSRFSELSTTQASTIGSYGGNSLTWRLMYWGEVLPLADANPVTGIGLGMTELDTSGQRAPHNDFVKAYVETGVIGLGAYLLLLLTILRTAGRAVRRSRPRTLERGVAAAFLGSAVAFVLASLAANLMSTVVVLWYLAVLAAAAVSVSQYPLRVQYPSVRSTLPS